MKANLIQRTSDKFGSGYFHAPRGSRKHNGVDFQCLPDTEILSPVEGLVTKIGYPYADDLSFRYIQITHGDYDHRIFYVKPAFKVGERVKKDDVIGFAQDLDKRYPEITPHIHYECRFKGKFINPEDSNNG